MSTGKFARTMQQAFGPYTSHALHPLPEPIHPSDKIVMWGCVAAIALMAVAAVMQ